MKKVKQKKQETKKKKPTATLGKKSKSGGDFRKNRGRSKYRGVQVNKTGRFFTQKHVDGKLKTLGTFDTEKEAAEVFDLTTFRQKGRKYKFYNFPENLEKYEKTIADEKKKK